MFLKSIVPCLWNNRAIITLNLSFCSLVNSFMNYLSDGLCHNNRLAVLDLRGNRVTCDGVSGICQALVQKYNGNLKEVDLSRNRIGDEGALRIAKMLTVNRSLQKLRLNRNQISDAGGKELAEAMKFNKNLEVLDLANNFLQLSFLQKL